MSIHIKDDEQRQLAIEYAIDQAYEIIQALQFLAAGDEIPKSENILRSHLSDFGKKLTIDEGSQVEDLFLLNKDPKTHKTTEGDYPEFDTWVLVETKDVNYIKVKLIETEYNEILWEDEEGKLYLGYSTEDKDLINNVIPKDVDTNTTFECWYELSDTYSQEG